MKKYTFRIETGRNEPKENQVQIPEHIVLFECTFDCDKHTDPNKFADDVYEAWEKNNIMNQDVLYYRTPVQQL